MHEICSSTYGENLPTSVAPPRYCRHHAGYGSFMINSELLFSVPNKCASQYMNQLAFSLMKIPKSSLHKALYRDAVQNAQGKFQKNDYLKMCESGEKVLIVRHPIVRIISAWNDKFNLNNTRNNAGLTMGIQMLNRMKNAFQKDYQFLQNELQVCLIPQYTLIVTFSLKNVRIRFLAVFLVKFSKKTDNTLIVTFFHFFCKK